MGLGCSLVREYLFSMYEDLSLFFRMIKRNFLIVFWGKGVVLGEFIICYLKKKEKVLKIKKN